MKKIFGIIGRTMLVLMSLILVGCDTDTETSGGVDRFMGDTTANVEESTLPNRETTTTEYTQTEELTTEQSTSILDVTAENTTEYTTTESIVTETSAVDSETSTDSESAEITTTTTSQITTTSTTTSTTTNSETSHISTEAETSAKMGQNYVLNVNSKRFHYPSCGSADEMKPENRKEFFGTREELLDKGYKPCGNCEP